MKIVPNAEMLTRSRILKGYTQRELARKAGISHAYVSMLERSMKTVGPSVAKRLSLALERPMEELFDIK